MSSVRRRTRLGVVSADFFDLSLGRLGGFGKMLQMAARFLREHRDAGLDLTLFHGFRGAPLGRCEVDTEGMRVLLRPEG